MEILHTSSLFFAKSSVSLLIILLIAIVVFIINGSFYTLISIPISLTLFYKIVTSKLFEGSRLFSLINSFKVDPAQVIFKDASLLDRYIGLEGSFRGFLTHYGIPRGLSAWVPYSHQEAERLGIINLRIISTKILSGYGSVLFELGMVGLIPILVVVWLAFKLYPQRKRTATILAVAITFLMITPVPIGFPYFCFLLGYMAYKAYGRLPAPDTEINKA